MSIEKAREIYKEIMERNRVPSSTTGSDMMSIRKSSLTFLEELHEKAYTQKEKECEQLECEIYGDATENLLKILEMPDDKLCGSILKHKKKAQEILNNELSDIKKKVFGVVDEIKQANRHDEYTQGDQFFKDGVLNTLSEIKNKLKEIFNDKV